MQKQIRKVGLGLVLAFLAVFFQLNYVQIFAAERIAGNNANVRSLLREYSIKRGDIITLDGTTVAKSEPTGGRLAYRRTYPEGDLYAHITGFYSINYGETRIESAYHDVLLGDAGVISMQDIQDEFLDSEEQGDDVRLTIHSRLQQVARDALGSNQGAVVAMDPQSGEVRAMWSNPSYDPTPLASHDAKEARAHWRSLDPESPESPLVSKATSRGYAPGSTVKVITTAAALESRYEPDSVFEDPVELDLPQTDETLTNFTKTSCAGGQIDLFTALEVSCDTTYAIIGMEIPDEVREMAEAMGFNEPLPFDVGTEASLFPEVGDDNKPFQAYSAIGQGDVLGTPLQMAVVAATVANGGEVPRPRLVREVIDPSGGIVELMEPEMLGSAMSTDTARETTEMMVAVVATGTGVAAQIPGVEVAGKTGTSQTIEGANPHAWFIAFAPANDPQLAVAVIVENGGEVGSEATGGALAAPIAKALLEADREIRGW
jgi:penicillin-binding protein A